MRPSPSSSSYAFSPFQLTHSRGVRPCFHMLLHQQMNFNSRTHVECDAFPFRTTFSLSNFNSRTHVECDYDCIDCHVEYYNISTHALTWSATIAQSLAQRPAVFQLTHSRGVRRTFHMYNFHHFPFQLTHSRGVRPLAICFIL